MPIVSRSACSLLALALALGACGGPALAPPPATASQASAPRSVPFVEVAGTPNSRYGDDSEALIVGTSAATAARIVALVPQASAAPGRVLIAAFSGAQRTGGFAIHIDAVQRDGDRLVVRATFTEPSPGAFVTQALTSPAHVVSIAQADAAGASEALLLDAGGTERARATLP